MITSEQVALVLVRSDVFQTYATFFNCFFLIEVAVFRVVELVLFPVAVMVFEVEFDFKSFVFKFLAVKLAFGVVGFDAG